MLPLGIPTAHESWNIRNWMLEIIDGVSFLHSLGVVHRDLDLRNILAGDPVVICDLQCLDSIATGHCRAPDLDGGDKSHFSTTSDVFALGTLLWCCYFILTVAKWPWITLLPILSATYFWPALKNRPTVVHVKAMLEQI